MKAKLAPGRSVDDVRELSVEVVGGAMTVTSGITWFGQFSHSFSAPSGKIRF